MPIINIAWWRCVKLSNQIKATTKSQNDWILENRAKRPSNYGNDSNNVTRCRERGPKMKRVRFVRRKIIANFKFDLGCLWSDLHSESNAIPFDSMHCSVDSKTDLNIWIFDVSDKISAMDLRHTLIFTATHWLHLVRFVHCAPYTSFSCHSISFLLEIIRFTRINRECSKHRTNPAFIQINRTIPNENFIAESQR